VNRHDAHRFREYNLTKINLDPSPASDVPNDGLSDRNLTRERGRGSMLALMPIRANIVGPPDVATRIKASIAKEWPQRGVTR
jgi:hypothetical protein